MTEQEHQDETSTDPGEGLLRELPMDEVVGDDVDPVAEEVGDAPTGQLVAPDEGTGTDTEKDLVADDLGHGAESLSAEEAAMHEMPEEPGG